MLLRLNNILSFLVTLLYFASNNNVIVSAWDNIDLELFDLIEEVGGIKENFYKILAVEETATSSEIRRAYRKLSLTLHPDKNKAPDAELKFRQLVSVYEVLKDEEKKKRYNQVLKDGLPDWRQPIYYYRRYRKMGMLEMLGVLSIILTIGHYIVKWSAYLEKMFELEELLQPLKRRREKRRAKGKAVSDHIDLVPTEHLLEENFGYKRPQLTDLLPFLLYRWVIALVKSIPYKIQYLKDTYVEWKERRAEESEEEEEEVEEEKPVPKRNKPKIQLRDASEYAEIETRIPENISNSNEDGLSLTIKKKDEWSEDEVSILVRAMAKFPGGTPGRWDKIATEIGGRTVNEITKKVKEVKQSLQSSSTDGLRGYADLQIKKRDVNISDSVMTKADEGNPVTVVASKNFYMSQDDVPDDLDQGIDYDKDGSDIEQYTKVRKRKVKTREVDESRMNQEAATIENEKAVNCTKENNDINGMKVINSEENKEVPSEDDSTWSQQQQKCLEKALSKFPKSAADRWTCISRNVPGKSKEECVARYKVLVDLLKKKKQLTSAKSE